MTALSSDPQGDGAISSGLSFDDGVGALPPAVPDGAVWVDDWNPRAGFRYRGGRLVGKRAIDLVAAVAALLALAPLLAAIAIAVRATSPGPALFRQTRIGKGGRPFTIFKYRTMQADAVECLRFDPALRARYLAGGYKLALDDDPRITRLGALLRRSSLDELPQLVNVLRGEMSIVGPRPVLAEELSCYGRYRAAYLLARPGLTGAWQVSGRDAVRFPGRALLDAAYLDDWSLTTDLRIMARTIPAALTARGVE